LWEIKRRFQSEFLISHGLLPEHRLLDVGCGTLRGGIPLIDYLEPEHYTGIEARREVLEEGRAELAEAGLEHKRPHLIHAADPAQVDLDASFDIAWAFSVLVHMTDDIADACLALVARTLREDGSFYANVSLGDAPEREWQGFPVVSRPLDFYARGAARHGLTVANLGILTEQGYPSGLQDGKGSMLCFRRLLGASDRPQGTRGSI